jgi:hypothetical protein
MEELLVRFGVDGECDEPAGKSKKPPAGGWGRANADMWRSPYIRSSSPRCVIVAILANVRFADKVLRGDVAARRGHPGLRRPGCPVPGVLVVAGRLGD